MNFKKVFSKKNLLILLIVALASYVAWDISSRAINYWRVQGYSMAVNELIRQATNEECLPFTLFSGDVQTRLINLDCLPDDNVD